MAQSFGLHSTRPRHKSAEKRAYLASRKNPVYHALLFITFEALLKDTDLEGFTNRPYAAITVTKASNFDWHCDAPHEGGLTILTHAKGGDGVAVRDAAGLFGCQQTPEGQPSKTPREQLAARGITKGKHEKAVRASRAAKSKRSTPEAARKRPHQHQ